LSIAISLWVGTLFAVGGVLKNLVESIIFLFFTHPYDVGDRVIIEGETLNVKEFGLMSTTFVRWDGSEIYIANTRLDSNILLNVKRSGPMSEGIELSVAIETTQAQFDNLKEFMQEWIIENESREILPSVGIFTTRIYDSRRIDINVILAHKSNHQNGGARVARRTRFMLKLTEGLIACGIELIVKPLDLAAAH
jgi:hypothetical protein